MNGAFTLRFLWLTCAILITCAATSISRDYPVTKVQNNASNETRTFFKNFLDSPETAEMTIEMILNATRTLRNNEEDLTLITFLQKTVKSYGQKKVAKSIYELAQKPLYDLIWMLAGDLDTYLIFDLYNVYSAANSDSAVLSVYDRFQAGNVSRAIVPEVFALDKKYDQYDWYVRVRGRMLISVDKYMAGKWDIADDKTPPPIEYDKDGKVTIAGVKIPESSTIMPIVTTSKGVPTSSSTKDPILLAYELEAIDSDEDIFEFLNLE